MKESEGGREIENEEMGEEEEASFTAKQSVNEARVESSRSRARRLARLKNGSALAR